MDIADISKIGSRKRILADAGKLRGKVSHETSSLIELRVGQDTTYWDLKEKLHQVENNHERLQQNMVEVQMQHETISGQYQEELRLRPETLNKLSSTRDICEVLESYSERLRESVSRCSADQATLCEAYNQSAGAVAQMRREQAAAAEGMRLTVEGLHDKLKLTTDHQNQLVQFFTATKQQADNEVSELKDKLIKATDQRDELVTSGNDLNRRLDVAKMELEKKEEIISGLQGDIKQLVHEFNLQSTEAKNTLFKQEKEIKDVTESNEALKKALTNQETYSKTVCDQNNQLLEKLAGLDDEYNTAKTVVTQLEDKLKEATQEANNLTQSILQLNEMKEMQDKVLNEKCQMIEYLEKNIEELKLRIENAEDEKSRLIVELNDATEANNIMNVKITELTAETVTLGQRCEELQNTNKVLLETSDAKIKELNVTIEEKDKDLVSKVETVNSLMSEVKNMTDIRNKLETNLQKVKKDMEYEKENAVDKENKLKKQVENLEGAVIIKDDEIAKQLSVILEMRNEKDRLQEKITSMQGTIDNIQKELTGRVAAFDNRVPAEQDDNAVMLTPARKAPSSPVLKPHKEFQLSQKSEFAVPRSQPKQIDSGLFSFLSDSSMDGDTLDVGEVNRRFEALSRGERVAPMALSSLKRRGGVPAGQGGLRFKSVVEQNEISLSQMKQDMKQKERSFFKNKRMDNKGKKAKQT